jgi:hypothetical protein
LQVRHFQERISGRIADIVEFDIYNLVPLARCGAVSVIVLVLVRRRNRRATRDDAPRFLAGSHQENPIANSSTMVAATPPIPDHLTVGNCEAILNKGLP